MEKEDTLAPKEDLRALRLKKLQERTPVSPPDGVVVKDKEVKATTMRLLKDLERILIFDICDEKHNSPQALLSNSIRPLIKILSNIREHPLEEKYRKLRYNNSFVSKSIIGSPSEKLLRLVGWTSATENFEKVLIYKHQKGSIEWDVACIAIDRLEDIEKKEASRIGTLHRRQEEKKHLLENTRMHIKQDEEERHSRFQYT